LQVAVYVPPANTRKRPIDHDDPFTETQGGNKYQRGHSELVATVPNSTSPINLLMPYKRTKYPSKRPARKYAPAAKRVRTAVKRILDKSHVVRCVTNGFVSVLAANVSPTGAVLANASGATFTVLNSVATGNSDSTRSGPKIKEVSLEIKGFIQADGSGAALVNDCLRLSIVRDHDGQGTAPAYGDVFDVVGMIPGSYESTMPRFGNRKRFTILADVCIPINTPAAGSLTIIPIHIKIPLNKTLTFSSDVTTLQDGSLRDGPIYMFQCSRDTLTDKYAFELNYQFKFKQL